MAKLADVADVATIAGLVLVLGAALNGNRSLVIEVDNRTDSTLQLISSNHVHGGFAEMPDHIPPQTASLFSSQSVGGSFETGTEGSCSYLVDGVQFDVYWDDPYYGSNSASQDYGGDQAGAFMMSDASIGVGNTGAHARYQIFDRPLANFAATRYRGNPALIQGKFNADKGHGNFELLVPLEAGGIVAYFRVNNDPGLPWQQSASFAQELGGVDAVTFIQSNYGSVGNLEVVARARDTLQFYFRDSGPQFAWYGPFPLRPDGVLVNRADGNPVLLQSRNGHVGNFELACPLQDGGIAHYWRDNDAPDMAWHGPTVVLSPDRHFEAITMIQSSYGGGQNLELIGQSGQDFWYFWRSNSADNFQWHGPFPLILAGQNFPGGGGNLALIQSNFGSAGANFELLGIVATLFGGNGPVFHAYRNNDDPNLPWAVTTTFGQSFSEAALTMIESDFGSPGTLEVPIVLTDGTLAWAWRDPQLVWHGPDHL